MLGRRDKPLLGLGVPDPAAEDSGNSLDEHPDASLPMVTADQVIATLLERVDYQQRLIGEGSSRLDQAQEAIKLLEQRLTQLEVFANKLSQQRDVAREMAERQTRYSALDLAIKASGPTADSRQMTGVAEGFLEWLRGMVH